MRSAPFLQGLDKNISYTANYKQIHIGQRLSQLMWWFDELKPELIVNFAALCEVGLSWTHAIDYYETNLMSLVRLTDELAKRSWFKKFVQIGSSEVYGSVSEAVDEFAPIRPSSPYATSKAAFDFHLQTVAKHQAFNAVVVMPSNGYCEGQTLNRIIPKAIIAALTGKKLQLQGGGIARKSYLHSDDISRAILLVAEKGLIGETYNCGPEDPISIRTLVGILAVALGKNFSDIADIAPERLGQDSQYWLDSTKIKALGWSQQVSLQDGLERVIAWVKANPELLTMDQSYTHRP